MTEPETRRSPEPPDRERIEGRLRELRRTLRSALTLEGGAFILALATGLVLLSLGVDRLFRLSRAGRVAALAVYGAFLLWAVWKFLGRPLLVDLRDRALGDILERRFPALGDRLRSAIDFLRDPRVRASEPPREPDERIAYHMKRAVVRDAAERVGELPFRDVVHRSRVATTAAVGLAVALAGACFFVAFPRVFSTWLERNILLADVDWPYRTRLVVEGFESGERGVPRGDPLDIRVRAEGEDPGRVTILLDYESDQSRYNLPREGSEAVFVHRHPAVTEDFTFEVRGGDYRSRPYRVIALERPTVEEIEVTLTPPPYTGRPPIIKAGELGELATPEGSTLAVRGRANKPLRRAWLATESGRAELRVNGRRFEGPSPAFRPEAGGGVTVHLEGIEGVPPDRHLRFSIHLQPDRLPVVDVRVDGLGAMITPEARMPLQVEARDDYRVEKLKLEWTLVDEKNAEKGPEEEDLPGPEEPGESVYEEPVWEVSDLRIEPEKRLNVRIGAVDNDGLSGPKTGYSAISSFIVVTAERLGEEFVRREEEQRRVVERLLEEEKGVRDAVYRLLGESWKAESEGLPEEVVGEMLGLARSERQHGRQAGAVADAIEQILTEMRNNRVGEEKHLQRLAELVVLPLVDLDERSMPAAASQLQTIRDAGGRETRIREGLELATRLEGHIATLETVIANMVRLEDFTEIVKHLRVIMRVHGESMEAATKSLEEDIEDLFEP